MASSTLALASAGSAVLAPVRDSSNLSSRSAFGTSLVQFAPVTRSLNNANRVVVVKANLSEDQPAVGKKILASFLAAGAALSIAGQALAGNPVDFAKSKADEVVSSAQNVAGNLPSLPKIELPNAGALQNAGNAAEGAVKDVQGRMDGIFGKSKPYPQGRVASSNGGTGSAIGDAKKRIANFPGKNPFAENLTKTTEEFNASIPTATGENSGSARAAREFLGQDSTRVDAATQRVKELGDNFKSKAGGALDEAKSFVGSAQNAAPDLPSIPSLPNPLEGVSMNMQDVKGDLASKASDIKGDISSKASSVTNSTPGDVVDGAKGLVGSAQDAAMDATPNFPNLPNPFEGISKTLQGKTDDVKGNVASKVDDVKGDVSSKVSAVSNSTPGDGPKNLVGSISNAADNAKDAAGSAQDTADSASLKAPSALNVFGGLGKKLQGKAADVKENVASTADNVKGDVSSKASGITNSTPGDAVDAAKNVAQNATSKLPSLPNPLEGLGQNMQGNAAGVKDKAASKVDDVKADLSSKVSSTPGDVADNAKNLVGDATSNLPSLPNPLEGLKGLTGNVPNLDNVPNAGNLEDGLKAKASLK